MTGACWWGSRGRWASRGRGRRCRSPSTHSPRSSPRPGAVNPPPFQEWNENNYFLVFFSVIISLVAWWVLNRFYMFKILLLIIHKWKRLSGKLLSFFLGWVMDSKCSNSQVSKCCFVWSECPRPTDKRLIGSSQMASIVISLKNTKREFCLIQPSWWSLRRRWRRPATPSRCCRPCSGCPARPADQNYTLNTKIWTIP